MRYALLLGLGVMAGARVARAQDHRILLDVGWGSLSADDPLLTTLSLRGTAGWVIDARNAIVFQVTHQSAARSEGSNFGKLTHQFVGLGWHHALRPVFANGTPRTQQYLLRIAAGMMLRGDFANAAGGSALRDAPFIDVGVVIRYPLTSRIAAVGTMEDAIAFLPAQMVSSYCTTQNGFPYCYPAGGSSSYSVPAGGRMQHNFGFFITLEWRP